MRAFALLVLAAALAAAVPLREQQRSGVLQAQAQGAALDPDTTRSTVELVRSRGFAVEEHTVTTIDGYILTIHRVLPPASAARSGQVVVLQHGLMDTSATWVINQPTESLGYQLAADGHDVWLANSRGSSYSKHKTWKNSDSKFWEFDFDQMAQMDVPATLTYVIGVTKVPQVHWVAHSQGCAISLAAFSSPTNGARIVLFTALAPVTYLYTQSSPLMKIMVKAQFDKLLSALPAARFVPDGAALHRALGTACAAVPRVCDGVASGLFGATGPNLDPARTGVYFGHFPDGTSTRNIVHWIRNARSGVYANFAGQEFNFAQYKVKTAVYYGSRDMLADPKDVQYLVGKLDANCVGSLQNSFAHMDFVWSAKANEAVYPGVRRFIKTGKF